MLDTKDEQTVKEKDDVERRSIAMYPDQWAIVDQVNEMFDFRNTSGALRHIINDYRRMKAQQSQADPA